MLQTNRQAAVLVRFFRERRCTHVHNMYKTHLWVTQLGSSTLACCLASKIKIWKIKTNDHVFKILEASVTTKRSSPMLWMQRMDSCLLYEPWRWNSKLRQHKDFIQIMCNFKMPLYKKMVKIVWLTIGSLIAVGLTSGFTSIISCYYNAPTSGNIIKMCVLIEGKSADCKKCTFAVLQC